MKILHVVQTHWYNAEVQYAWDLAARMAERGHEVHAMCRPDSLASLKAVEAGLTLFTEEDWNRKGFSSWRSFAAHGRFKALLERERYDAVVIHRSEGLVFMAAACGSLGIPCVRVRGDMRPVKANPVNRWIYSSLVDRVVASNKVIAEGLRDRLGVKAEVIYGGVDEALFNPGGPNAGLKKDMDLEPGAFLVGILGRMSPLKGHGHFLDAAKIALKKAPHAAFVLMIKSGREPLPEVLDRLRADNLLASRVRFLGQRRDLPAVLRDFGLGVVASTSSEANCRVGLEWMASGVPLLATSVGVLPEIVSQGETGFVVPPASPFEMAEKIVYFANNPDMAVKMGEAARLSVEERFTLAGTAEKFTKLLEKAVTGRKC